MLESVEADQLGRVSDRGAAASAKPLAHLPSRVARPVAGPCGRSGLHARRCCVAGGIRRLAGLAGESGRSLLLGLIEAPRLEREPDDRGLVNLVDAVGRDALGEQVVAELVVGSCRLLRRAEEL